MREVKSIKKISDSMQELDQLARSLVKNPEDALFVAGSDVECPKCKESGNGS